MRPRDSARFDLAGWRRYWFVLPTIAFVAFAVWALLSAQEASRTGVVPLGTGEGSTPRSEPTLDNTAGEVSGPDMELPVYSPGRVGKSTRRAGEAWRPRRRGVRRTETQGAKTDSESGLKIPCIFRDDCEGAGTDSTRTGAFEEDELKIPSIFESR